MAWVNTALTEHPEHAIVIANIIAAWNTIEDEVCSYLELFFALGMGDARAIASKIQSSKGRVDFVAEAGKNFIRHNSDLLAEFEDILAVLQKRIKHRNLYAHAIYVTNLDDRENIYIANRTTNPFDIDGYTKIPLADLHSHMRLMVDAKKRLFDFRRKLENSIPQVLKTEIMRVQLLRFSLSNGEDIENIAFD